jgi:hypothetical protein
VARSPGRRGHRAKRAQAEEAAVDRERPPVGPRSRSGASRGRLCARQAPAGAAPSSWPRPWAGGGCPNAGSPAVRWHYPRAESTSDTNAARAYTWRRQPGHSSRTCSATRSRPGPSAWSAWRRRGPCTRGHVETVVIDGQKHKHKLGVWYANQKQRRDKLTPSSAPRSRRWESNGRDTVGSRTLNRPDTPVHTAPPGRTRWAARDPCGTDSAAFTWCWAAERPAAVQRGSGEVGSARPPSARNPGSGVNRLVAEGPARRRLPPRCGATRSEPGPRTGRLGAVIPPLPRAPLMTEFSCKGAPVLDRISSPIVDLQVSLASFKPPDQGACAITLRR